MKEKIQKDLRDAMRVKNELRLSVLRMLSSAMHNREIEKRAKGGAEELSEEEVVVSIRSEVKKRRDAITEFTKGGRQDLVDKESAELKILEEYLPQELAEEEIEKIVREVITAAGMAGQKDFGRAMGEVMKKIKGRASGDRVSGVVRRMIGS